jgi:hypothetical protein
VTESVTELDKRDSLHPSKGTKKTDGIQPTHSFFEGETSKQQKILPFFHISKRQEIYCMPNIQNVARCCLASLLLTVAKSFTGLCDAKHDVCVIIISRCNTAQVKLLLEKSHGNDCCSAYRNVAVSLLMNL